MTSTGLRVNLDVRTRDEAAACPRYQRRLSDTAVTGREVVIRLRGEAVVLR
jgi:hypothetical protein